MATCEQVFALNSDLPFFFSVFSVPSVVQNPFLYAPDYRREATVEQGFDRQIEKNRLAFLYMPFMHSELPEDQARSVQLFTDAGLAENARFALHHQAIVARFGRFPHRNAMLGRESTDAERAWLSSDDAYNG